MYLAGAFVILALVGIGSATPVCDPQTFLPCAMPLIGYFMGPEGQQLAQATDIDAITETQMVSICRMGRTAFQCFTGAADRCIPSDVTELREFLTGVNGLMAVCDRPDLYSKTRLLMQCGKLLNQTRGSKSRACGNIAMKEAMADVKGQQGRSRSDHLEQWRTGETMKKMCCNVQYYETCSGTEVADKCGAETQQITTDIHRAILAAFNCNGARLANCPARAPPTEADANMEMDFNQLMAGMGGMGGPPDMS